MFRPKTDENREKNVEKSEKYSFTSLCVQMHVERKKNVQKGFCAKYIDIACETF